MTRCCAIGLTALLVAGCGAAHAGGRPLPEGWASVEPNANPGYVVAPALGAPMPSAAGAGWRIRATPNVDTPPHVCRERGAESVYLTDSALAGEFDAFVRLQLQRGTAEVAGLVFGWQDPEHYHLARANTRTNNLRLYRRAGGRWALLAGRDLALPVGQWHELRVSVRGGRLLVGLDGEPLLEVPARPAPDGQLALWAGEATAACFAGLWARQV